MNARTAGFLLLVAFTAATARAELKWEQTAVELKPEFGDKTAVGHFKYQNVGKTPVKFKSVHSTCGCTTAQTQKDQIPPGEKGEITATFTIGGRTGTQVKQITVQTDDPAQPTMVLTLKAILPEMMTVMPTFVFWTGNEEAKPKTILLKAGRGFDAKNVSVSSTNPDFLIKVEPGKPGEWTLNVQPKSTQRSMSARLTIQTDFPKESPRSFVANASVTAAPASSTTVPQPTDKQNPVAH